MKDKIVQYLMRTGLFSRKTCEDIANEIISLHYPYNLGLVQDILMKYLGGEDDYGYETSYEMARKIVRLLRQ